MKLPLSSSFSIFFYLFIQPWLISTAWNGSGQFAKGHRDKLAGRHGARMGDGEQTHGTRVAGSYMGDGEQTHGGGRLVQWRGELTHGQLAYGHAASLRMRDVELTHG